MPEGLLPLLKLLETRGPEALMGAIFAAAWWWERKENRELNAKLFKLSNAQLQVNTKILQGIRMLREMIRSQGRGD